jgi:hypothetical protein
MSARMHRRMKRGPPEEGEARPEKRPASEAGKKRSLLNALAKLAGTQVDTVRNSYGGVTAGLEGCV